MRPVEVSSTASSRLWLPKLAILGSRGDTLEALEAGEAGGRSGGGAAEVGETWGSVSTLEGARMHAAVSQRVVPSVDPSKGGELLRDRNGPAPRQRGGCAHLFWPPVFTCMGVPLREGWKSWVGRMVSFDL